jgi:hypothetical protein
MDGITNKDPWHLTLLISPSKMSSGQTLAQMNLTCIWLEAILYGRVETLVTIANVEYFGRNQVVHSLPMRHG